MTISTQDSKVNYQGNGQTTVFQIPFPFLENNQIYVQKKDAEGNLINYTYATDYTVTGAGEENGGSVTLNVAPEQGSTISIYRDVPLTQEVDYRENEIFPAETHEEALDKLTMEVQQLQEQLDRSIKVDRFSDVDLDIFVNEIERVYDSTDNIDIVANNINDVNTVSGNIANVNTAVTNMAAIQDAPNQAISAQNSASQAAQSAQKAEDKADEASESARLAVSALSLQVGDIGFAPLGIDESLNLRRYLNGQVIIQSQFVAFTNKVKSAIVLYPNLATTETNWQAEKTNSKLGQCGKFVIDDTAGTIRLPCVVNAQGLVDLALIGGIKSESLPNIKDTLTNAVNYGDYPAGKEGVISTPNVSMWGFAGASSGTFAHGFTIDASKGSNSYQDNAPVQQEAVQYPYYIQVATGVEEELPAIREYKTNVPYVLGDSKYFEANPYNSSWLESNGQYNSATVYPDMWSQLQVELNSSLNVGDTIEISGKTYVKRGLPVKLSTDTYDDYDFAVNQTEQTFRLPLKSKLASGSAVVGNGMALGLTDGTTNRIMSSSNVSIPMCTSNNYGVNVGAEAPHNTWTTDLKAVGVTADTTKSGIETSTNGLNLYFYVGDTVQDASLINAGVVLGQLSNKADVTQFQVVSTFPAAPDANVFYFIPE